MRDCSCRWCGSQGKVIVRSGQLLSVAAANRLKPESLRASGCHMYGADILRHVFQWTRLNQVLKEPLTHSHYEQIAFAQSDCTKECCQRMRDLLSF